MDLSRTILRGAVGPLMIGHGTQKLFGWFGGYGLEGTGGFFESLGMRPGRRHATAAGAAETLGGVLVAAGALTPVASTLISSVMMTAIRRVHAKNEPWVTSGGYEYNVVLIATMAALTEVGPGPAVGRRRAGAEAARLRLGDRGARGGGRGILAGDRAVQRARGARVRARAAVPARGGSGRSRLSAAGTGSHTPEWQTRRR
jgi:putative oxidoreductase